MASVGRPLDRSAAAFYGARFGFDFSGVRVHASPADERSAGALNARAYTVGTDVVFGSGEYNPHSKSGALLLAHELAHVVQQQNAPADPRTVEPADSRSEREASAAARAVIRGERVMRALKHAPHGIARDTPPQAAQLKDDNGAGYNDIVKRTGGANLSAIKDLMSIEKAGLMPDLDKFKALGVSRVDAVIALESFAAGTAAASWFATLKRIEVTATLNDPATTKPTAFPITAHYFKGTSDRKALVLGGVHEKTEPQGELVANKLVALLQGRLAAGKPPFFTAVVVPKLFDAKRYDSGNERWITGGMGADQKGKLGKTRSVEPNRNFPLPGDDLAAAQKRGAGSPTAPELLFDPPGGGTPRAAQDTAGAGHQGTSTRLLPETRALIALIETFHPERIASVHAHSLSSKVGDAPGIFVDPRAGAAQAADDDRLANAMVSGGQKRLAANPIAGAKSSPFAGNAPGTPDASVRYASGAHAEGNSLGTWAPAPVTSGAGKRAGITTVTVEVPQWDQKHASAQLDQVEALDAALLNEIFLEDPAKVTPPPPPPAPTLVPPPPPSPTNS